MSKKTVIKIGLALFLASLLFVPLASLAQVSQPNCPTGSERVGGTCVPNRNLGPQSGVNTFSELVNVILTVLLAVVGLIATLFLVVGGYQYVTAGGDEEKVKGAKQRIINSLIGLAVVLLALALVRIVSNLVSQRF